MDQRPVVILGGGINGAALARELALNGVGVWLVDIADLAFGATAYSSRLIHGGLRYLEFAEFSLVRESLEERGRLLRLAPHLVKPLRLFIPVRNTWGGLTQAAGKFLRLPMKAKKSAHRGLRVVQMGLWLYDRYARDGSLPPRSLHIPGEPGVPRVGASIARKLWAYSDAQITFPERMVVDFLHDARELARERGTDFRVFTYSRTTLEGSKLIIRPAHAAASARTEETEPLAIVNATGAWVDSTLGRLPAASRRLMGGTKGTHFVTYQARIKELLAGQAIYTEARDGRPVFLLPFGEGTLVGTTDLPFEGDPAAAVATEDELTYLLAVVNDVFPGADLARGDIQMHQCGVRPLPYVDAKTPAAITRRHQLVWNEEAPVPLVSLVGGKLTTCRSLAEETAAAVLGRIGRKAEANSRERAIPVSEVDMELGALGTPQRMFPTDLVKTVIEKEWVTTLEDLVERRLVLHFSQHLSRQPLIELAEALVTTGKLAANDVNSAVARCEQRLSSHFGITLNPEP